MVSKANCSVPILENRSGDSVSLDDRIDLSIRYVVQLVLVIVIDGVGSVIKVQLFICVLDVRDYDRAKVEIHKGKSTINLLRDCVDFMHEEVVEIVLHASYNDFKDDLLHVLVVFVNGVSGGESEDLPQNLSVFTCYEVFVELNFVGVLPVDVSGNSVTRTIQRGGVRLHEDGEREVIPYAVYGMIVMHLRAVR